MDDPNISFDIDSDVMNTEEQLKSENNNFFNNIDDLSEGSTVPKIVFIVPYRDREQQFNFFSRHMKYILEDYPFDHYKIYYIHQCDDLEFNRGAMKNIGFLAIREKYPLDYQDITLVFNDIDTMPYTKNFLDYDTNFGIIKHFYGFTFALGGIFSIKCSDFERINGFPNFWAWGFEDNLLNKRALSSKIIIDRNNFYPIADKNIMHLSDGMIRSVNRTDFERYTHNTTEGFSSIHNLIYKIDESIGFINVYQFSTGSVENVSTRLNHDLRNGNKPFNVGHPASRRSRGVQMGMIL
jgi:hypothetical protein